MGEVQVSLHEQLVRQLEQVSRRADPWKFIEDGKFRIRAKDGKVIRLDCKTMKRPQLVFYEYCKSEYLAGRRIMVLILKYRQGGFSTGSQEIIFSVSRCRTNYNALTTADTKDRASWLHGMSKFAQEYLEKMREDEIRLKRSNKLEIVFSPNNSVNRIGSAESKNVGITEARNALHASEVAYYANWTTIWGNVYPSISDIGGNIIIVESTANGVGGPFHNLCLRAKDGNSAFKYFFFAWFEDPENQKTPPSGWHPTPFVAALMKNYGLTKRQGYWYEFTLEQVYEGNRDLMAEKYPSNDIEAFRVSGTIVFSSLKDVLLDKISFYKTGKLGNLYYSDAAMKRSVGFRESECGDTEIIEPPEAGESYVQYSDVGEGLKIKDEYPIVGGEKITTTYNTCVVRNARTWKVSALMENRLPPDVFSDEAEKLAYFYNTALWAVEIPGPGIAVTALKHEYPNFYRHEYRDPERGLVTRSEWGFRVGEQQNAQLEAGWQAFVRENPEKLHARIAGQALVYIQDKTGRHRAKEGCFIDILKADMGCIQILKSVPAKSAMVSDDIIQQELAQFQRERSKSSKVARSRDRDYNRG